MKKVLYIMALFFISGSVAFAEDEIPLTLSRIDFIKIHVKSHTAEFIHYLPEGGSESSFCKAGTPTKKNRHDVPFGVIGTAYKATLNPGYIPTKKHLKEQRKKGVKHPKKFYYPGDKENPLGIMKLYFSFPGIDPELSFGMHTTNKPSSVGHSVSEGCARILEKDARENFGTILEQNGEDATALFEEMAANPKKSIPIILEKTARPKVAYFND
jgi:hypothetical protein